MKLAAFTVLVPDYDPAIAFFRDGLGFTLTEDTPQGPKRWVTVAPPGENIRLVLARAEGAATVTQRLGPWGVSSVRVKPSPSRKKAMAG